MQTHRGVVWSARSPPTPKPVCIPVRTTRPKRSVHRAPVAKGAIPPSQVRAVCAPVHDWSARCRWSAYQATDS
eukprot:3351435-Lingulodinium_polyedra.AAC.1